MAKRIVTTPTPAIAEIERSKDFDVGLVGMLDLLAGGSDLDRLTTTELVTVYNQIGNVKEAALNGLSTVADLLSAFDLKVGGEVDTNGVSWLLRHLTDTLGKLDDMEYSASCRLGERGYDGLGRPLPH